MTESANEFVFQQTLKVHDRAVRAVSTSAFGDVLMSGGGDNSNKMYTLNELTGKYDYRQAVAYHDGFVMCLCPM